MADGLTGWARESEWLDASQLVAISASDTDWAVAHASNPTIAADSNDAAVSVLVLDGTSETGVGLRTFAPHGAETVRITVMVRAQTAASGDVQLRLYGRAVDGAVSAWSSAVDLDAVTVASLGLWVLSTTWVFLSDLDIEPGRPCLLQLTRNPPAAGDTLATTSALMGLALEWL